MAWKTHDWQCHYCGRIHPETIKVNTGAKVPKTHHHECPECGNSGIQQRVMSPVFGVVK